MRGMGFRHSMISAISAAIFLASLQSLAASWLVDKHIDNETGLHAFENAVVRYEYSTVKTTNCVLTNPEICFVSGCEKFIDTMENAIVFGTGIGKFLLKNHDNYDICGKWSGRGTGFNQCDYSKPVISDETETETMIEYKVTQARQTRWERFYKGLAVIEQEMISTDGAMWLSDVLVVRGEGAKPIIIALNIEEMTYEMSKTHQADWGDGDIHRHELWTDANVMYKGHAIFGMIDKNTGIGTGIAVEMGGVTGGHAHMLFQWRYNFEPISAVEYWDDPQRAPGAMRYYFAINGGGWEELVETGKQIVDEGVESLPQITATRGGRTTGSEPRLDVVAKDRAVLIRLPGSGLNTAEIFDARGMSVRRARADGREELQMRLPDAAAGVYLIQVDTGYRTLSEIVRIVQ